MAKTSLFLHTILISMDLAEKSQATLTLFAELERDTKQFVSESGLACVAGCGYCCANPKVPASALEFLPLAFDLYEKGLAESTLALLENNESSQSCIIYRPRSADGKKGSCGNHQKRGMICRLFSASARRTKYGTKELIMCKVLKGEKSAQYGEITERINKDMEIPLATAYYSRLTEIDDAMAQQMTINDAIATALELVLRYRYYQDAEMNAVV